MKKNRLIKILIVLQIILISSIGFFWTVYADEEQLEVKIPVSVVGNEATVGLFDGDGVMVKRLSIEAGGKKSFKVECSGFETIKFTLKVLNEDTDRVTYDKKVYLISVDLYRTDNGEIHYTITADPTGVLGNSGKPDEFIFKNETKDLPNNPGGDNPPNESDPPKDPDDSNNPDQTPDHSSVDEPQIPDNPDNPDDSNNPNDPDDNSALNPPGNSDKTDNPGENNNPKTPESPGGNNGKFSNVNTGDDSGLGEFSLMFTGSVLMIIFAVRLRKKIR